MNIAVQAARHFREIHFGGNWTWSNMKEVLSDVTWEEAAHKMKGFNSIAALTYHIHYFVKAIRSVLENQPLAAHDKYSYDHPPVNSAADWEALLAPVWADAEACALLIEQLPETQWDEIFVHEKYGTYYRNIHGCIEHAHYHLGQIVMVKKMIRVALPIN